MNSIYVVQWSNYIVCYWYSYYLNTYINYIKCSKIYFIKINSTQVHNCKINEHSEGTQNIHLPFHKLMGLSSFLFTINGPFKMPNL